MKAETWVTGQPVTVKQIAAVPHVLGIYVTASGGLTWTVAGDFLVLQ